MGWAKLVCEQLDAKGHWCDYMDPCSGLAVRASPEPGLQCVGIVVSLRTWGSHGFPILTSPLWCAMVTLFVEPATSYRGLVDLFSLQ